MVGQRALVVRAGGAWLVVVEVAAIPFVLVDLWVGRQKWAAQAATTEVVWSPEVA